MTFDRTAPPASDRGLDEVARSTASGEVRRLAREEFGEEIGVLLASRYWNSNGRAVCVVATRSRFSSETLAPYWRAFIGGGEGFIQEVDQLWVARHGDPLDEPTARALFPQFEELPYRD